MSMSRITRLLLAVTTAVYTLPFLPKSDSASLPALLPEQDNRLTSQNSLAAFPGLLPLTCPYLMPEEKITESPTQHDKATAHLKMRLIAKITVHPKTFSKKESTEYREKLSSLLINLYQNNHLDQCKLDELLTWKGFHIELTTRQAHLASYRGHLTTGLPKASYKEKTLFIPIETFELDKTLEEMLSHELTHAYDAYANEKHGILNVPAGKYTAAHFFGHTPALAVINDHEHTIPDQDMADCMRVIKLLNQDRKRLKILYDATLNRINKKPVEKNHATMTENFMQYLRDTIHYWTNQNPSDNNHETAIKTFRKLIKINQYKPSSQLVKMPLYAADLEYIEQHYQLIDGCYRLKPGHDPMNIGNRHIHTISAKHDEEFLHYALHWRDAFKGKKAVLYLGLDLLKSLITFYDMVEERYLLQDFPEEFHAYTDQVLAPYSTPREGYPTLAEWLLPNYSQHLATRATEKYMSCLKRLG